MVVLFEFSGHVESELTPSQLEERLVDILHLEFGPAFSLNIRPIPESEVNQSRNILLQMIEAFSTRKKGKPGLTLVKGGKYGEKKD